MPFKVSSERVWVFIWPSVNILYSHFSSSGICPRMDLEASSSALESNTSTGNPASASAEASTVTAKRRAEGEASVGSDDEEVSPQSTLLAELSCHSGRTRTLRARLVLSQKQDLSPRSPYAFLHLSDICCNFCSGGCR